jgi:hypothetical protein
MPPPPPARGGPLAAGRDVQPRPRRGAVSRPGWGAERPAARLAAERAALPHAGQPLARGPGEPPQGGERRQRGAWPGARAPSDAGAQHQRGAGSARRAAGDRAAAGMPVGCGGPGAPERSGAEAQATPGPEGCRGRTGPACGRTGLRPGRVIASRLGAHFPHIVHVRHFATEPEILILLSHFSLWHLPP